MIALAYYLVLGLVLAFTHGHYSEVDLLVLTALHVAYAAVQLRRPERVDAGRRDDVLVVVLLGFTLLLSRGPQLSYGFASGPVGQLTALLGWLPVAAVAVLGASRFVDRRAGRWVLYGAAAALVAVLVVARVLVLDASPRPFIDVFTQSVQAVKFLLEGKNPYVQPYADIYEGKFGYIPNFAYWPGYLYWASAFAAVLRGAHDVRVSIVAAELVTAVLLFGFMRSLRIATTTRVLVIAVWLAFPVDLFVIEQAWIDPVLLMPLAGAAWALAAGRPVLAGALLGWACGTKQYAIVAGAFALVLVWRVHGLRTAARFTAAAGAVALALVLPFAVADWDAFYVSTVRSWGDAPPRLDSLSLPALAARQLGVADPAGLWRVVAPFTVASAVALVASLVWLARRRAPTLRDWFVAMGVYHGVMLLFSKQAFCNYYYYLSFFILGALVTGWAESDAASARPAEEDRVEAPAAAPPLAAG